MIESLEDFEKDIINKGGGLYLFYEKPEKVVAELIKNQHVDAVVVNRDYTPYSIKRDQKIDATCKKLGVSFCSFDDALLHSPDQTLKGDGKPYTVFTPFYRNAMRLDVKLPVTHRYKIITPTLFLLLQAAASIRRSFLSAFFRRAEEELPL